MEIESNFDILPTTDGEFVMAIRAYAGQPQQPKIFYMRKGEHALLYRSDDDVIVLDYLPPEVRELFATSPQAFVVEIDQTKQTVQHDYVAPIQLVARLPFDLDIPACG